MARMSPEFFRFVLSGAINTGATYVIFLISLLVLPYLVAYTIAYAAGVVISYILNSHFVFRRPAVGTTGNSRFMFVYAVQYVANAALLWLLVDQLGVSAQVGMIVVISISVPLTFLALRKVFAG